MSRTLPFRPNLEHLAQAKALLHDLQAGRPDAQLADAQHQLAQMRVRQLARPSCARRGHRTRLGCAPVSRHVELARRAVDGTERAVPSGHPSRRRQRRCRHDS